MTSTVRTAASTAVAVPGAAAVGVAAASTSGTGVPPGAAAPAAAPPALVAWVESIAALARPDRVHWVDGSRGEQDALLQGMVAAGTLVPVNPEHRPYSFVARSHPEDVARVESRTFICSADERDAGPTNNWRAPEEMRALLEDAFAGAMRGRTMYVVPFSMGPLDSPMARIGVQLTDSPYVVVSTGIMTRMGAAVLERMRPDTEWVRAVHSVGAPLAPGEQDAAWPCNEVKYISHFPETREIWSFGSAYGGNAILAKKSFALRIASVMARDEGWLAEHMCLVEVTDPRGRVYHVAAAFPSACGKTNFAMIRSPLPGWTAETLGDDIAWLFPDAEGRLRAINPEAGLFGVAPGTGPETNATALETVWGNTIFTNVAMRDDGDVWWEGMTARPPAHLVDWTGRDWTPASRRPAAHPNSRFTVRAEQVPTIAREWDDPQGVVVDAIVFGGRRATNVPLVLEADDWEHGVFLGATVASERTAAAEGVLGELRRDPFAMAPFCGYDMAGYWAHWLRVGAGLVRPPRIFQVNWFRRDAAGRFLWPGFGDNMRVLAWMLERVDGRAEAVRSPLGLVPAPGALPLAGTDVDADAEGALFDVDPSAWLAEADDIEEFFARFDGRVPGALSARLAVLRSAVRDRPTRPSRVARAISAARASS